VPLVTLHRKRDGSRADLGKQKNPSNPGSSAAKLMAKFIIVNIGLVISEINYEMEQARGLIRMSEGEKKSFN
jgi:hypothetical protein